MVKVTLFLVFWSHLSKVKSVTNRCGYDVENVMKGVSEKKFQNTEETLCIYYIVTRLKNSKV